MRKLTARMASVGVVSFTPSVFAKVPATPTIRPEPVEGLSFSSAQRGEGKGFDKLSPNGFCGSLS
jgi:hypothetical protein